MINITLNGKPFEPSSLEDMMIQAIADHLRQRLGAIRHPETGEFPTVAITGTSLDDLTAHVEGSPELLDLVQQRLAEVQAAETTTGTIQEAPQTEGTLPRVFLSYAFEDQPLAQRIANELQANAIETWWAEWCIAAGDSIRQRIDEGLRDCTHFLVLLTATSIIKPWVNQEMDAGLVKRLNTGSKFIALRSGISSKELPPLLQGMLSPSVDIETFDIQQLIHDIHGVSRKPPLGPPPAVVSTMRPTNTGYSPAATALAKFFVDSTSTARKFDPQSNVMELCSKLSLSQEDVDDAIFELKGYVTKHFHDSVYPEETLFATFDKYWLEWDAAEDALQVAGGLVNDENFPSEPEKIAERLGWGARRLNPALAFLLARGLITAFRAISCGPWLCAVVRRTDATRRFVKSR